MCLLHLISFDRSGARISFVHVVDVTVYPALFFILECLSYWLSAYIFFPGAAVDNVNGHAAIEQFFKEKITDKIVNNGRSFLCRVSYTVRSRFLYLTMCASDKH